MRVPRLRNIAIAVAIVLTVIGIGLVIAQDQERIRLRTPVAATDAIFPDYLATLLGRPLTFGDAYAVYTNGDAAFPAMLGAIGSARHRISFETYVFDTGAVAERFVAAFEAAGRRGVQVRLVLDAIGASPMDRQHIARLEEAVPGGGRAWPVA